MSNKLSDSLKTLKSKLAKLKKKKSDVSEVETFKEEKNRYKSKIA